MKTKFLVGMLLAGSSLFAGTHFSIGIGVGGGGYAYVPPPVVYAAPYPVYAAPYPVYAAPYPGPGFAWVDGYWYQAGPRRLWRAGYWAPSAYGRGYRVAPRGYYNRFNNGRGGRR